MQWHFGQVYQYAGVQIESFQYRLEALSPSGATVVPQHGHDFENFLSAIAFPHFLQSIINPYDIAPTIMNPNMIVLVCYRE